MDLITKVLYWISTGLMIPVVIFLLILFLKSLMLTGTFYTMFMQKVKFNKHFETVLDQVDTGNVKNKLEEFENNYKLLITPFLLKIIRVESSEVFLNKVINDFELACKKDLANCQTLAKLGPILGLMGTLIPMGPALVGLASGDIASMASNMQVAFSTTVIGLMTGAIGYLILQIKKRWYSADVNNLEFLAELLFESSKQK